MGKPAARVSDPTACPLAGHDTNPLVAGSPDVIIEGLPAARLGDPTACGSAIVADVCGTVFFNGKNAAIVGSQGDHGNTVTAGAGTVFIGDVHSSASFGPSLPVDDKWAFSGQSVVADPQAPGPLYGCAYTLRPASTQPR